MWSAAAKLLLGGGGNAADGRGGDAGRPPAYGKDGKKERDGERECVCVDGPLQYSRLPRDSLSISLSLSVFTLSLCSLSQRTSALLNIQLPACHGRAPGGGLCLSCAHLASSLLFTHSAGHSLTPWAACKPADPSLGPRWCLVSALALPLASCCCG